MLKLLTNISIVLGFAFGIYAVYTGNLKFQPIMCIFFGIALLLFQYKIFKNGDTRKKRSVILFTIPYAGVLVFILFLFIKTY